MLTRLMTLAATMVAMMGCATLSPRQLAELELTQIKEAKAAKAAKAKMIQDEMGEVEKAEVKAKNKVNKTKLDEALSTAELAKKFAEQSAAMLAEICKDEPNSEVCKKESTTEPDKNEKPETDEPDFTTTPIEEPSLTIEVKGFNKDGIKKLTSTPDGWGLSFEKGKLVLLVVGEEADQLKRYQWGYLKDGCYKLKDSGKFTPESVPCPSAPPPPPVKRGQGQS